MDLSIANIVRRALRSCIPIPMAYRRLKRPAVSWPYPVTCATLQNNSHYMSNVDVISHSVSIFWPALCVYMHRCTDEAFSTKSNHRSAASFVLSNLGCASMGGWSWSSGWVFTDLCISSEKIVWYLLWSVQSGIGAYRAIYSVIQSQLSEQHQHSKQKPESHHLLCLRSMKLGVTFSLIGPNLFQCSSFRRRQSQPRR